VIRPYQALEENNLVNKHPAYEKISVLHDELH